MFTYFTERWDDISGYKGLYSISDHGRIKSHEKVIRYSNGRAQKYEERILKLNYSNGYRTISLVKEKVKMTHMAHILVGNYFVQNPEKKPFINHLDGDRSNNHYLNLEWSTNSENQLHSYHILGRRAVKGEANGLSKLKEADIFNIRRMRTEGKTILAIADVYDVSFETIRKIIIGKNWSWLIDSPISSADML